MNKRKKKRTNVDPDGQQLFGLAQARSVQVGQGENAATGEPIVIIKVEFDNEPTFVAALRPDIADYMGQQLIQWATIARLKR